MKIYTIYGSPFDTNEGQTFNIEINSPAYFGGDANLFQGSFAYEITLPNTFRNRQNISNANRIDAVTALPSIEVVFVAKIPLFGGTLKIRNISKTEIRCGVTIDIIEPFKSLNLRDLDFGLLPLSGSNDNNGAAANSLLATNTLQNPFDFDVLYPQIFNPAKDDNGLDSAFSYFETNFQNQWNFSTQPAVAEVAYPEYPQMRVYSFLDKLFQNVGYSFQNKWQTDDELRLLMLYSNKSIDTSNERRANLIVPKRKAAEVLKDIVRGFNLFLDTDTQSQSARLLTIDDVLDKEPAADWTNKLISLERTQIESELPSNFQFKRSNEFMKADDALKVYQSATPSVASPEGFYLPNSAEDYSWHRPQDANVSVLVQRRSITPFDANNDTERFTLPITPLLTAKVFNERVNTISATAHFAPSVMMPNDYFNEKSIPTLLYFYRGIQENAQGYLYPLSTSEAKDSNGAFYKYEGQNCKHELTPTAIYNKYWRRWIELLKGDNLYKGFFNLSHKDIAIFKKTDIIRVKNQHFLIKKMKYSFIDDRISQVETELIRL